MMKLLKSDFQRIAVAITLGTLSAGFTPAATAASTYDATAGLTLTLSSVTDLSGSAVSTGWLVGIEPFFPTTFMDSTGDGSANASTTSDLTSYAYLGIGDEVIQTSASDGTTSNGTANSSANIGIYFQTFVNELNQSLIFNFDYDITAIAEATGDDAQASASVSIEGFGGNPSYLNILASANSLLGPSSDNQSTSGVLSIELPAYGNIQFNAILDTEGSAASVVPVPAAVWLFGSGLLGLIGVARRKKA